MDWTDYLSSTIKLIDLHDNEHVAGSAGSLPNEERAGLKDGLWFDMAVSLIEYLRDKDVEGRNEWIYLSEFTNEMEVKHGIKEIDVQFVVNYLSTPSRIHTVADNKDGNSHRVRTTKKTNLVERPPHKVTDRCRLTQIGRQSLQIAKVAGSLLYTKHDAQKLQTAIMTGDFDVIAPQAVAIIQTIRSFSIEVTQLSERPGDEESWQTYSLHSKDYLQAINDVESAVMDASELFATQRIMDQFNVWVELQQNSIISAIHIQEILNEIMQSTTQLRRKLSSLIEKLSSPRRAVIGNVNFGKAALYLASNPISEEQMISLFVRLAPWSVDASLPSAIDLQDSIQLTSKVAGHAPLEFSLVPDNDLPAVIVDLLDNYKQEIMEELRKGPVSLTSAIKKGWIEIDGESMLSELIGIYSSPDWMGDENKNLGVGFQKGGLDVALPDGSKLIGDELIMALIDKDRSNGY